MTRADLHRIPEFSELKNDLRFIGLLMYLHARRPKAASKESHGMIQDGGKLEAFLQFHEDIKEAFLAPVEKQPTQKQSPFPQQSYADPSRSLSENQ